MTGESGVVRHELITGTIMIPGIVIKCHEGRGVGWKSAAERTTQCVYGSKMCSGIELHIYTARGGYGSFGIHEPNIQLYLRVSFYDLCRHGGKECVETKARYLKGKQQSEQYYKQVM